jgi:hypothetical protein
VGGLYVLQNKMKRTHKIGSGILACLVVVVASIVSYSRYTVDYDRGLAKFVDAVNSSDDIQVLEGLPHPTWEGGVFEKERQKPHSSHHGHLFYKGEIALSESDKKILETLFVNQMLMPSSWDVAKACGGFHPDFRVVWLIDGHPTAEALFCFSCAEVHFYSGVSRCKADMSSQIKAILEKLWWPYRAERPEPKLGEQVGAPNPLPAE